MNRFIKVLGITVALLTIGGCSIADERRLAYLEAKPLPALEVPAHLAPADTSNALMLPQVDVFEPPLDTPPAHEVPVAEVTP